MIALVATCATVGALVAVAPAARALTGCPTPPGCGIVANEDDYSIAYTNTGVTLTEDAAHGVLANDQGPATTVVDLQDTPDTPGTHTVTTYNGFTATINHDGSFTYAADNTFSGVDAFDYYIWDSTDHTNADFNTVYITITPTVKPDAYATNMNQLLTVPQAAGVTANDLGVDPTSLTFDATSAHGGTVTDGGNGAFEYSPPPNFFGNDTFTYDVWDINADKDYQAVVTVHVVAPDTAPPVASLTKPAAAVTLSTSIPVTWSANDGPAGSGVHHYDVQVARAPWNATFGAWTAWQTGTTATSGVYRGGYGSQYCFRMRAVDNAANASGWQQKCTSIPMRASSLTYSSGWTQPASAAAFAGATAATKTKNAHASLAKIQAKRISLVVTKCSTCGTIQVRWNNVTKATFSLRSATTLHQQIVALPALPAVQTGTLTIIVTTSGQTVSLEAVVFART